MTLYNVVYQTPNLLLQGEYTIYEATAADNEGANKLTMHKFEVWLYMYIKPVIQNQLP